MKKTILCLTALSSLLWSCGKNDTTSVNTCTVQEQRSHPGNDSARLFIPNAFTPNGDGINDFFGPVTAGLTSIEFFVYDSDNNLVFRTNQLGQLWSAPAASRPARFRYQVKATTTGNDHLAWCGEVDALPCIPDNVHFDNLIFADQFDPGAPEGYLHSTQEQYVSCN